MKKRLFFSVILTAVLFTSCAKQGRIDPKETLVQEFVQFCDGQGEGSVVVFQEKFAAYEESDFSEEQLGRLKITTRKIGFNPFATYTLSPNLEENIDALEREKIMNQKRNTDA